MSSGWGGPPYEAKIRALGEPVDWRARALEAEARNDECLVKRSALDGSPSAYVAYRAVLERMSAAEEEVARLKAERPGLVREGFRAGQAIGHEAAVGARITEPDEDATVQRFTGGDE